MQENFLAMLMLSADLLRRFRTACTHTFLPCTDPIKVPSCNPPLGVEGVCVCVGGGNIHGVISACSWRARRIAVLGWLVACAHTPFLCNVCSRAFYTISLRDEGAFATQYIDDFSQRDFDSIQSASLAFSVLGLLLWIPDVLAYALRTSTKAEKKKFVRATRIERR